MIILLSLIVFIAIILKKTCSAGVSVGTGGQAVVRQHPPLGRSTQKGQTRMATERATPPAEYRVYPQRWFVLLTVCLLALSNAAMWQTYTSLTYATAKFYCDKPQEDDNCRTSLWTSQIFQIVGVLLGIMGMYITDRKGIKLSTRLGCFLNCAGALLRVISSLPSMPLEYRSPILHLGTTIAASAQPFFLVLSPKVAEHWFPSHQRAFANVLSFIANPLGVALGTVLPVQVVHVDTITIHSYDFLILNSLLFSVPFFTFIMSLIMRHSNPPSPPSASSDCHSSPDFLHGLIECLKNPHFHATICAFGVAFAQLWAFFSASDRLFTELGYSPSITAYLIIAASVVGVGGSLAAGAYVDRTKKFKEVVRCCMVGFTATAIAMNLFTRHSPSSQGEVAVLFVLTALMGLFSLPVFPLGIELGIEATFPVQEATSSGLLVIFGQLTLFAVIFLTSHVRSHSFLYNHDGSTGWPRLTDNHWLSLDVWCVISGAATVVTLIGLRPPYKRVEYERRCAAAAKLATTETVARTDACPLNGQLPDILP